MVTVKDLQGWFWALTLIALAMLVSEMIKIRKIEEMRLCIEYSDSDAVGLSTTGQADFLRDCFDKSD